MKFFGRTMEVDELRGIRKLSRKSAHMTVVTDRRRHSAARREMEQLGIEKEL